MTDQKNSLLDLPERIFYFMKQKKMSISDLCKATGISQPGMYRIIKGITSSPSVQSIAAIAYALDLSLSELIGDVFKQPGSIKVPLLSLAEFCEYHNNLKDYIKSDNHQQIFIPCPFAVGVNAFAIIIENDLFAPYVHMNDRIFVDPETTAKANTLVLAQIKADLKTYFSLKKLVTDGRRFFLEPILKLPSEISLAMVDGTQYKVVGRVVGKSAEL